MCIRDSQDIDGFQESEDIGFQEVEEGSVERARDSREESADGKSHYLVLRRIDPHGFRCDFILADGNTCAAVGGVDDVFDAVSYTHLRSDACRSRT